MSPKAYHCLDNGFNRLRESRSYRSLTCLWLLVVALGPTLIDGWSSSSSRSLTSTTTLASQYLQIPDHQAFIGKLYYYRLPITTSFLQQIRQIVIKEVDRDGLPDWLILKKEKDRWELIGFPQDHDKRIHFFQVQVYNKDDTQLADVFTLDVNDLPVTPSPLEPFPSLTNVNNKKNCILRVIPTFTRVLDVWSILSYLIPSKLRQEVDLSAKLSQLTNIADRDEDDDPNVLINHWAYPLFTITQSVEKDGSKRYQLTIDRQDCVVNKERQLANGDAEDDFRLKLQKLGLEFHHIEIIKSSPLLSEETFSEDQESRIDPEHIDASRPYSKPIVPVSINNNYHERRHARRHLPNINPTPIIVPDFMTLATSKILPQVNPGLNEIEPGPMSRIVPSLTSPSAFPSSMYPLGSPPPLTPRLPDIGGSGIGYTESKYPQFYTTPTITSEPPTDWKEGLSTPTPALTSKFPELPVTQSPDVLRPQAPISPSPTFGMGPVTSNFDETGPSSETAPKSSSEKPDIRPEIPTNARPELKNRIPKLAPTAGKYWTFKIPSNTFIDREDGTTDKLKLGFYRVSGSNKEEREHPAKDYWIQFDSENQVLTAFPTDDDVGLYENQFYLEAVDSGGLSNVENITIHVRQHTSYRKFPYNITFHQVYWDPLKITTTVEALRNFAQIISQINGEYDIDSFIIQHLSKETRDGKDYWTIAFTNESMPAYPCPKKRILQLYNKLADKQSKMQYAAPSELLSSKMNKMFEIGGVGLSISCSKPNSAAEKPELRNPIEKLPFKLGQVFRFKIPENMFYSGRGRDTYNLELSLYDGYGRVPPPDGFVKFDEKTHEIIGLAVDKKYIGENEFNLVARDQETGNDASDAFVILIEDTWNDEEIGFYVTIGLSLNEKMDIDYKLDIANRISTLMFNDSDSSALRVLKIVKRNFTLMQSGSFSGSETKRPLPDIDEDENTIEQRRRRRRKRSDPFDNSINESSISSMYEYVWTNITAPLLVRGKCPSPAIQAQIIEKLYGGGASFESWDAKFADKYRLMSIEFKAVGKCSGYLTNRDLYRDNIKPNIIQEKEVDSSSSDIRNYGGGKSSSKDDEVHANELDDYYLRTIIPAIATVALLLVVLCILVFVLVKCRRDVEKNRFDMANRPGGDGFPSEVDAFLQKGRVPVILQSELQQHLISQHPNSFMMSSNPPPLQQYPMRHMSTKSSYHALHHSAEQRRQPPPYGNK